MPVPETYFDERLTVAVPEDFRDAVRAAAAKAGLTIADYARAALSERLARDGVEHQAPPQLSPANPHPRQRGAVLGGFTLNTTPLNRHADK